LVTGVGRSGTKFMQESLNAIGGDVSHDNTAIAKHGAVAWPLAVRETGHLDPLQWNGTNGYELPSFSRKAANTVVGTAPRARFEKVFHQVGCIEKKMEIKTFAYTYASANGISIPPSP
jgi:hypothetical protein